MHVLFADDQPDIRRQIAVALAAQGHMATLVEDGVEAVAAVAALDAAAARAQDGQQRSGHTRVEPFDVILLDAHMPKMDGLNAVRHIRALSQGRDVPIVLFTAYGYTEQQAREAGANLLLRKPILPASVIAVLESLCLGSGGDEPQR